MTLRLTLDIFSGRPNPTIEIKGREAEDLLGRFKPVREVSRAEAKAGPPPILGYRGLIVEQVGRPTRGLPRVFTAAGGRVYGEGVAHAAADPKFDEDLVLDARLLKRFGVRPPKPDLMPKLVRQRLQLVEWWKWPILWPIRPVCPCAPVYEPAWWNDGGQKQLNNNCYNYGCNYRTDTFAQPGKASSAQYTHPIDGPGVRAGAIADALEDSPSANNKCPKAGHLVALVIAPAWDFHWYRKGLNGRWTHKPGSTKVTNLDNSGALIPDPRTADRGPYTQFTTFMVVKHGHIKIK